MRIQTIRGNTIVTVRCEQVIDGAKHSLEAYASVNADDKLIRLARTVVMSSMFHRVSEASKPRGVN